MTISRLVLILRVAGFVCMLMVALYWWPPFLHLLDPLSVGATVALALIGFVVGLFAWGASFCLTFFDDLPTDPKERRRRMAVGLVRVLAEWVLIIVATPVAFVSALGVMFMLDGGGLTGP